jgi:histidine ammonia-lyase
VASLGVKVGLSPGARSRMLASRRVIERIVRGRAPVYGVNTGFGRLSSIAIDTKRLMELQVNLVRSHCCGLGEPLTVPETRAMLLLRANVLAKGFSGCRPAVAEILLAMLDAGIHPIVPSKGSVGASGDLAPLAHLALGAIGEGSVLFEGEVVSARAAFEKAGLDPLDLGAKEGLSLINGTEAMKAVGTLAWLRASELTDAADVAGAMTLEALGGSLDPFDDRIQTVRPHPGQRAVASRIRSLTRGSELLERPPGGPRVQDAYSLRCMPQVHGAIRGVLSHAETVLSVEINSATDNPLVFAESGDVLGGGNFHGEPVAFALDYLAIAMAELGAISERRIERLVNPDLSGLPPFLTPSPGLSSGLMILHVSAVALCGENKVLAHPASVDSLPTSGNQEDHVSMGMTAALKLRQIVDNAASILAIELICAAQALEFSRPARPGHGTSEALSLIRGVVAPLVEDRTWSDDVARARELLRETRGLREICGEFHAVPGEKGRRSPAAV